MLFCWTRKLIFVHVYKTGGTSITHALNSGFSPAEQRWHRIGRRLNRGGRLPVPCWNFQNLPQHLSARELQALMPARIFEKCFKFAFVSNPWSLKLSLYRHMLRSPDHHQHGIITALRSFDAYIDWLATLPNGSHSVQTSFLRDGNDVKLMNYVGRFERLAQDFAEVADRLGLCHDLPHLNRSDDDPDYRKFYSATSRNIVAELHRPDLEAFGYDF